MMFLLKPKKLHLDLFTCIPSVYEFSKPTKASDWFPQWWKALPNQYEEPMELFTSSTMRRCTGFTDLYGKGFIAPLWGDLRIEVGEIGSEWYRWRFSGGAFNAIDHPVQQRGTFLPNTHYAHIKLINPWCGRCAEPVDFMVTFPTWNQINPDLFFAPPAVVNFKYQQGMHVNAFLTRSQQKRQFQLDMGHPMLQFVPLTERELVIKHHLVDAFEYQRLHTESVKFTKSYATVKKAKRSGCPIQGGA